MQISLTGLATNLRALAEELAGLAERGDIDPIDDDFIYHHQPRLLAFSVETLIKHLGELQADPAKHAQFFATYVDAPDSLRLPEVTP